MSKNTVKYIAAAIIYIFFAVYLYLPYFENFRRIQYLLVVNAVAAAMGCYALSRRWIAGFAGSFFAGAIYGFGPYFLSLAKYHPTAGFLAALIPWLFLPAAFGPKGKSQWLRVPLCALPFLAIVFFFEAGAYFRLFAIPIQNRLRLYDLTGLLTPLVMVDRSNILIGFYHVPVAALVIGLSMLLKARRYSVIAVFASGTILAFCGPLLNVSPAIWLTLPMLCCSVLTGEGIAGLTQASFADRKWILASSIVLLVLAVVTLLLATKYADFFAGLGLKYTRLFAEAAKMYIVGAITVGAIFFMARGRTRLYWLRLALLSTALAVDIFLGAKLIVDKVF